MIDLTEEQRDYISYTGDEDTKLLACAGSGKTRCVIEKLNLRDYEKQKNDTLVLTFSRFTRDDFINKIEKYNAKNIPIECVKTIDSFAKKIIDTNNEIDVSLLSYKFMKYLKNSSQKILKKNKILQELKYIYVDEAQDLNLTQYTIFILLKEKLKININLIGDPNQNIYQFRDSSEKYLNDFPAKIFYLTKNFRSYDPIINFCDKLRPHTTTNITGNLGKIQCKPHIFFHKNDSELESLLLQIIDSAKNDNIELSDIAILSPTRGRMKGHGKSYGLCFVSNILYKAKIKFKQFYEESTDEIINTVRYKPKTEHVNLLTFMGSKGLEWKYVILVDADMCLINKRKFNEEKHNNERYLLYVACSRAIKNLFIFSRYRWLEKGYVFNINSWFDLIDLKHYTLELDDEFKKQFHFSKIKEVDILTTETRIFKLIDKFSDSTLDTVSEILHMNDKNSIKIISKMHNCNFAKLEEYSSHFLNKLAKLYFNILLTMRNKTDKPRFIDLENIIEAKNIILNASPFFSDWYYGNRNSYTWDKYDVSTSIPSDIRSFIDINFDRDIDFSSHTVANDGYYSKLILTQKDKMNIIYKKYMETTNETDILQYLFMIVIFNYSIYTQHYFHLKSNGRKFRYILKIFEPMFEQIRIFTKNTTINFIDKDISVSDYDLVSECDLVSCDKNEIKHIWDVKCSSEITLKNMIKQTMTYILFSKKILNKNPIQLNFINFLKGEIITVEFSLIVDDIKTLFEIFGKHKNK